MYKAIRDSLGELWPTAIMVNKISEKDYILKINKYKIKINKIRKKN